MILKALIAASWARTKPCKTVHVPSCFFALNSAPQLSERSCRYLDGKAQAIRFQRYRVADCNRGDFGDSCYCNPQIAPRAHERQCCLCCCFDPSDSFGGSDL